MQNEEFMTIEDAIDLAVVAHRGQKDKQGRPYILHLLRVMFSVLCPHCTGIDMDNHLISAVLHDIIEDTTVGEEQLRREGFSEAVIWTVKQLTKADGESYEDYIERCAGSHETRIVKLADLNDHLDQNHHGLLSEYQTMKYRKAFDYLSRLERG